MKKKLLIVNDSTEKRNILKDYLQDEYDVFESTNGMDALETLKKNRSIAIVLLELYLQEMTGLELLREVRDDSSFKNLIIMATTSKGSVNDETMALSLGADDYIRQPVTRDVLMARLKNVVMNREMLYTSLNTYGMQQNILDNISTSIFVVDAVNFNLYYMNKACQNIMNCDDKKYSGKKCYEYFYHENHPCRFCKLAIAHTGNNKTEAYLPPLDKTVEATVCLMEWMGHPAYVSYYTDITEEKKEREIEEERFENELMRRYRVDLDFMAYIVFNVTKGIVMEHDPHGFPVPTIAAGRPMEDFTEKVLPTVIDYETRNEFVAMLSRDNLINACANGEDILSIDYRRYSRNEKYIMWARSTIQMMEDPRTNDLMAFLYTYDINERKMMQEIIDAIVQYDYKMLVYINLISDKAKFYSNHEELFQHSAGQEFEYNDIVNEFAYRFVPSKDRKDVLQQMSISTIRENMRDNDVYEFVVEIESKERKNQKLKMRYINFDKSYGMVLWTAIDVTDIFDLEKLRNDDLTKELAAKTQANDIRRDYSLAISDEMRMPLKNILTLIRKSINDVEPGNLRSQLEEAKEKAEKLGNIINDFRDISLLEANKVELEENELQISDVLYKLKTKFCRSYAKKKHNVVLEQQIYDDDCVGDLKALERILGQVLDNAFKFTDKKKTISIQAYQVPAVDNSKLKYHFIISDEGCGIALEKLHDIFKPFYAKDKKHMSGSSGLGLAIAKGLARAMGGDLSVESELGVGTRVVFDVTMLRSKKPAEFTNEIVDPAEILEGKKILFIESSPLEILVIRKLLEKKNVTVEQAMKLEDAKEILTKNPNAFDVVCMSLDFPETDREIQTECVKLTRNSKLIGIYKECSAEGKKEWVEIGVEGFIAKPLRYKEFINELSKYFN
ncbi:MAG: response regulator [Phascolarctobacterium sp.]|nr:response regulator [Phascolarctobacterium sp.]